MANAQASTSMSSVTIPSQAQNLLLHHKTLMSDFKIDYQVRRDNNGQESVHKVYIPSKYKGWLIMAEKEDAASPRADALQPNVPVRDHQKYFFPSVAI